MKLPPFSVSHCKIILLRIAGFGIRTSLGNSLSSRRTILLWLLRICFLTLQLLQGRVQVLILFGKASGNLSSPDVFSISLGAAATIHFPRPKTSSAAILQLLHAAHFARIRISQPATYSSLARLLRLSGMLRASRTLSRPSRSLVLTYGSGILFSLTTAILSITSWSSPATFGTTGIA